MLDILVSINCITYNHQDYIADAIESFLMQKTNFPFEIVIGEDCSTDSTMEIIQSYKERFPQMINVVTSEKNVGMFQNGKRVHEASRGKYIAVCEGDDYWLDPYKLQKQIDYMEKNPTCSLCFHNARIVDVNKNILHLNMLEHTAVGLRRNYYRKKNSEYSAGELTLLGSIPTNSMVYKKSTLNCVPDWYYAAPSGDVCTQFIAAAEGYAYYIDEFMSVYRFGVPLSVTTQWRQEKNVEQRTSLAKGCMKLAEEFDAYTGYKYTEFLSLEKMLWEVELLLEEKRGREVSNSPVYKKYREALTLFGRMKFYLHVYFPDYYHRIACAYRDMLFRLASLKNRKVE